MKKNKRVELLRKRNTYFSRQIIPRGGEKKRLLRFCNSVYLNLSFILLLPSSFTTPSASHLHRNTFQNSILKIHCDLQESISCRIVSVTYAHTLTIRRLISLIPFTISTFARINCESTNANNAKKT